MIADRYQLLELITAGGRSSIVRARDTLLNREVAIKRHVPSLAAFHQREADALARISHPNVVTLCAQGSDADGGFLVLELLHGETLNACVQRGPLPVPGLQSLARQGLQALTAIHAAGIIHRDVTPANLMLLPLTGGGFHLKFIDFELAQAPGEICADTAIGSVHFMAPEQFENRPLDARTDLYAFGAVLHFAASQRYLFDGETNAQIITAHLHPRCESLAEVRPDLPQPFVDWLTRLCSRDPEPRQASAADALSLLEAL